jgi:hypothetical protein
LILNENSLSGKGIYFHDFIWNEQAQHSRKIVFKVEIFLSWDDLELINGVHN